jgi:vancomycin resistance protein YoaR
VRIEYAIEGGAAFYTAEYACNYPKITGTEGRRIVGHFIKLGYSETCAIGELYRGYAEDIERLERLFFRAGRDSEAIFSPDAKEKFAYTEACNGQRLDTSALNRAVRGEIGKTEMKFLLKTQAFEPENTPKELAKRTKYRAGFSTGYEYSKAERKANIALAASLLNGVVVPADEVFSFNKTVGRRTEERGFKSAPIISKGKLVDGIGGGVCQVSTTLYNAALYADIPIVAAKQHSAMVSYVQPSFDAMVSQYNDLRCKNNTGFPLYIAANADGKRLKISFYGMPIEKGLTVKLRSEVKEIVGCTDSVIENDGSYEIPEEGFLRISNGSNGCTSEGFVDYYMDGALVKSVKIREDRYQPMSGIVVKPTF